MLSGKLIHKIESCSEILTALSYKIDFADKSALTRTHFNAIAKVINLKITLEVLKNTNLVETYLIIGKQNLEMQLLKLRLNSVAAFINYLKNLGEYRVYNWISGKTLQSYWQGGDAKYVKLNVLLVFLEIPFKDWKNWQTEKSYQNTNPEISEQKTSLTIVKKYFLGNYFLYYPKTDDSKNYIKTPFIIEENNRGEVVVQSISEGHKYLGEVTGIRDGCLYINCQNIDFEEIEQYVFNVGLETKPEVLFGVSNTVSVKNRLAVALKNVLVKQKSAEANFNTIDEIEIGSNQILETGTEEYLIINYLKNAGNPIIVTQACCNLADLG
ncbi:MAG: hypothetical protein EAZ15_04485 [Sphingobacteriales bacterium]|nr:MAG: hypothetical protein EAZ15_04485 [Sphingobacteriales bacterium]